MTSRRSRSPAGDRPNSGLPDGLTRRGAGAPPPAAPGRAPGTASRPGGPAILYEDENLVIVDKPAGLPTIAPEGASGRARSLYDWVTEHIRRRNPKGRAAVVHRLDRDSSGVVVFATGAAAKRELMSRWNELVRARLYVALVEGRPAGESGVLDSWLRENRAGTVYPTPPGLPGSLRAVTRWKLLGSGGGYSLLELELETGRKHQIRVQLSAAGLPVAGDFRYGARTDPAGRLALHAVSVELERPFGRGVVKVESPVPECFFRPLRGREKVLYYDAGTARRAPPPAAGIAAPGSETEGPAKPAPGGGYMKEKSKQAKEPKKKAQNTLKDKRNEKTETAANKSEE